MTTTLVVVIAVLAAALAACACVCFTAFMRYWPRIEKAEVHRMIHRIHAAQNVADFDEQQGRERMRHLALKTALETEDPTSRRGIPDSGLPGAPATFTTESGETVEQPADFSDMEWEQAMFRARAARGLTSIHAVIEEMRTERRVHEQFAGSGNGLAPIGL